MKMMKKRKFWLSFIGLFLLCVVLYGVFWFLQSYKADDVALEALISTKHVTVTQTDDYILFVPNENFSDQSGLVYYPGAKVDPKAYANMSLSLATQGIPVIIIKMPFNFAIFDIDKALGIIEALDLDIKWAIGGHSLGGAMASELVYKYPEQFTALILFASYANSDLSDYDLDVLSIWGSQDAFVTEEKINEKKNLLPTHTIYAKIEGGNHSQFGNYGFQNGDNASTISADLQLTQIIDSVTSLLKP